MNYVDILLLAISLSIDACVVSFAYGLVTQKKRLKTALALSLSTGFFQFFMPTISFICTDCVKTYIQPYAKWIVFIIFLYLGINFIKESFETEKQPKGIILREILILSVATSIDAFSAGIYLSLYQSAIILPAILIGLVTFINSNIGFCIGYKFKKFKPQMLEILGGVILIILATKAII